MSDDKKDELDRFIELTKSPLVTKARYENANVAVTFKRTRSGGRKARLTAKRMPPPGDGRQ